MFREYLSFGQIYHQNINLQILEIFSKEKQKTRKEKIVHVGYPKRTLENWATFSFPRGLSISFERSTVHSKKILKNTAVIYLYYHLLILISFKSGESY